MRINKFLAQATGLSRRAADAAIAQGRVNLNGRRAELGDMVSETDTVQLDGQAVVTAASLTIMLNKPAGYVCSRHGQGSRTIYELLPAEYQALKPVGRLDKDSSGLLLLTNDGDLANRLAHPSHGKTKLYEVVLDRPLTPAEQRLISSQGVSLEDGPSRFELAALDGGGRRWRITMHEGRNRQIRRTFAALGCKVRALHRTRFGDYGLDNLAPGQYALVRP